MRILVVGGGTAGHVSPVLATIEALQKLKPDLDLLYLGQVGGIEAKLVKASGLKFVGISAGKFRRYHNQSWLRQLLDVKTWWLNIRDGFRLAQGFFQSVTVLRQFQPDVVFAKGGYVSLPVGLAAAHLRIPYVVHESDTRPGLTNRILSRRAARIAVGFPAEVYRNYWPGDKLVFTGSPIRSSLAGRHRLEGVVHFKLDTQLPIILVMGGSLGARSINELIIASLPVLLEKNQVIHVTGERDFEWVGEQVAELHLKAAERYVRRAFLEGDLGLALAAADLVISRAGANAIAELAALAKPAILIPGPHLTDQLKNAVVLSRQGAARVLYEDKLTASKLIQSVDKIIGDEVEQKYMGRAIAKFANHDAAEQLAKLILQVANGGADA